MAKLSYDGKFNIILAGTDDKGVKKVSVSTEKTVSIWEIAHVMYIDCVCDPQITADKLHFDIKTKTLTIEVTISKLASVQEVLSAVCDFIKI